MKNNYLFWDEYLKKILLKLQNLLKSKKEIYADFHIHSDYSVDSNQSLEEIINKTNAKGFDIISITDHDSIKVYDHLFEYLKKNKLDNLIIIPGVEFTINNKDYGSQFHILQLMINPKSESLQKNILYQEKASWIRINKQFKRLRENQAIQYFFKKYKINCSVKEYKEYLETCFRPIPEYKTIMEYLMNKIYKKGITNWDILKKMKEWNKSDKCSKRKKIKSEALEKLELRFKNDKTAHYNQRFFHCMLAIRGADDDFFPDYKCMGDLSVNNYNELKINELNKEYITVFAHPSENKLQELQKIMKINPNISGMEYNKRCPYTNKEIFDKYLDKLKIIKIIGSDSHELTDNFYNDINFYKYDKKDLKKLIEKMKIYLYKK